jgi:HD-like signal output (HDOD) protein
MSLAAFPRERILRLAQDLPSTPAVLGRLQHLLAEPNSEIDDICLLLKRDMAMSARVLRVSNSAYFSQAGTHTSLEEAVGCIGFQEIYKIVGLTVASQLCSSRLSYYGCSPERLWENIVASALAIESLAQFVGINPRSAYTAGLMRSMGKVVLDRLAVESVPAPAAFDPANGERLGAWEKRSFGGENPEATALLLQAWNFPAETIEAVRKHYHPCESQGTVSAGLLNLAGGIAQGLGCGLPGEEAYWAIDPAKLELAGLTEDEIKLSAEETRMALGEVRWAFAVAA